MSNVHGIFSNRDEDSDDSDDNPNNRYVGGVSARGGGSGLAVEPNTSDGDGILSSIRANASQATGEDAADPPRRTITLYRSSFTVDNGPERRLDDPNNADFLRDLAKGVVPRELQEDGNGDATVGLADKRKMEYEDDISGADAIVARREASFTGEGQSLGTSATVMANSGVISPAESTTPLVDDSQPTTVIQVRLLNGKRLRVKMNKNSAITVLVEHINASGDAGSEDYVLSAGFPPKILEDLGLSIEESGLAGAQVIQKKA